MNLEELARKVEGLTQSVAEFIDAEASEFEKDQVEFKGKSDLVSYVDKTAEKKIVSGLQPILPEAGFITEEKTVEQYEAEYQWIIDPLDGTTNFVHGIPAYSISIALVSGNELLIGVVHDVPRKETFTAWKDGGSYLNGERIYVSEAGRIDDGLFATGFPFYNFSGLNEYLAILTELMKKAHGLRRIGSAALDMAYVACGRYEGYFEYNLNPWDIAAGALLVKEAGGRVSDFTGGENYLYGREMVAGGAVHQEILDVIQKFWK